MADIVFVRANQNAPIREGDAVSMVPRALPPGTGAITAYTRPGIDAPASGQAGFAQSVLAGRFRNTGYYYNPTGSIADNPAQPTF